MAEIKEKIKVAFIKFGGLCTGGTEKHLQTLAANLPAERFDVTYFYCDAAPYIGSDFKHLDTDPHRLEYMKNSNVKIVKFDVRAKDITHPHHEWVGTNFWDVFNESDFDIIQTGRSGHPEYPFTLIDTTPIVDSLHLADQADLKDNVKKIVLVGEEQRKIWVSRLKRQLEPLRAMPEVGHLVDATLERESNKTIVIPPAIEMPVIKGDLRDELSLSPETVVYGMHQRDNDGIFSEALLVSWFLSEASKKGGHLVILGGSKLYEQHSGFIKSKWPEQWFPNTTFLPATGDTERVHKFLNTLNVYTHTRKDGEQCSSSVIEALSHSLPVIIHHAESMGHQDQIGDAGFLCDTFGDYADAIDKMFSAEKREGKEKLARKKYEETFSLDAVIEAYTEIYEDVIKGDG